MRNKKIVDLLSSHNFFIKYKMSFQYEAAIANTVIQKINSDGGVFITECFERYLTCFSLDNIDFSEYTTDGS